MFKTLINNGIFWFIFILEMAITHLMLFLGDIDMGTKILGVSTDKWTIVEYSICWGFALFSIPLFILTQKKIPLKPFENLMAKFDLEIDDAPGAEAMANL